jgi:hypothetical protein
VGPTFTTESRPDWLTLYGLLERMNPRQRTDWLHRCCVLASQGADPVRASDVRGETDEIWAAYRTICGQGRLTVDRAGRVASRILGG